jgi:hypothetical protein
MEKSCTKSLEKGLIDLCLFIHTEYHSATAEPNESVIELSDILQLDSFEALGLIKDTLTTLIRQYFEYEQLQDYKDVRTNEGYEKALQKLESEVRSHIQIE